MFYALACAAIGGVIVLRRRRVTLVPLLGVIGAVALTVGAVYGTTRFRAPAEVPIVLLAAVAFDEAIGLAVGRRRRAVAGAAAPVPVPDADPG